MRKPQYRSAYYQGGYNLYQWQAGDIVTYDYPHEHIAIVSDKRGKDGVPYILQFPFLKLSQ